MKRLASILVAICALVPAAYAADAPAKPAATPKTAAPAKPAPAVVDSLALLERAVAKDSTKFETLYRLGVMYLDRERMQEASRVLWKANELKPHNVHVLVNLGVALDAVGHADDAQGFYKEALKVAPGDSVALCRLASSIYAQGKYNESVNMLRELIKSKPRSYCAYFTMGVAFADAGIYRDAIRMWRKVVEIAPESPEGQAAKRGLDGIAAAHQGAPGSTPATNQ